MSFAALKKSSKTSFVELRERMERENTRSYKDDRFWEPTVDKAGNGYAVIRFLPTTEGEDAPFVKYYAHSFKVNGKYYIEGCPTTVGMPCPACEDNTIHWNSGTEAGKDIARSRKRKLFYICNILVLEDSKNPETVGNVYLFKANQSIFRKITAAIQPQFEDETPFDPFDFWAGADFKIKIFNNSGGFRDYDRSEFTACKPLFDGDDRLLEALWKKQYKISELVAPHQFKDYDKLKQRFEFIVNGGNQAEAETPQAPVKEFDSRPNFKPTPTASTTKAPSNFDETPPFDVDDEDDGLDKYAELLQNI